MVEKRSIQSFIFEINSGVGAQLEALRALVLSIEKGSYFFPLSYRLSTQEKERIKKQMGLFQLSSFSPKSDVKGGLFILTSGSSSFPKIAFHSWKSLIENAAASARALGLEKKDVWHLSLPLWHIGGVMAALRSLSAGASVTENLDKATFTSWIPTHLYRLIKEGKKAPSMLKCSLIGGAPVDKHLLEQGRAFGYAVKETYGLTEMGAMVTLDGIILPKKEVQIDRSSGEVLVRGEGLFEGYVDLESGQLACPITDEGWFRTGDLGEIDSKGRLHVVGRLDNLFISGGENIQPEEIERLLNQHRGVLESVVVPIEDAEYGQRPAVFIKGLKEAQLEEELKAYLLERVAKFKVPILWLDWPASMQGISQKPKRADFQRLIKELIE